MQKEWELGDFGRDSKLGTAECNVESCSYLEVVVSHCNTTAHTARLLALECGASNPEENLKALGLKQLANEAFEGGNLSEADELYTEICIEISLGELPGLLKRCVTRGSTHGSQVGSARDRVEEADDIRYTIYDTRYTLHDR